MSSAVFLTLTCSSAVAAIAIQSGPHLENIDNIFFSIEYPKNTPVLGKQYRNYLKTRFERTMRQSNLNVSSAGSTPLSEADVSLKVHIELAQVPQTVLFALRIETVMGRRVRLPHETDEAVVIARLWGATRGIGFVSRMNLVEHIERAISEQINQFLRDYRAAQSLQAKKAPQAGSADAEPDPSTDTLTQTQKARYAYIASKNSNVFHKPECPWAENIKPENFEGYSNKDQVIKTGKRPCKWCKP
jgi:hypothetical protein